MTDEQRNLLHNLLMGDVAKQAQPGTTEWKIYDESVTEDILKMEPLIDIFIHAAKIEAVKDSIDTRGQDWSDWVL
jgi:hypothetical protein